MTETTPRDDIEFLSGSWTRLEVLDAMRQEPKTRRELKDMTDVSRVTLSRILADLEDRGWINKLDGEYHTTAYGKVVASELTGLIDYLETADRLGDAMAWLQPDEFDFELACLRDADVITPDWEDFTVQINKFRELFYECDRIHVTLTFLPPEFIGLFKDATANTDVTIELILDEDLFDMISENSGLRTQFEDMVDSEQIRVFRYGGDKQLMLVDLLEGLDTHEDIVMLCGYHKEDTIVKTQDPEVRRWAKSYFNSCKSDSRLVQSQAFTY